jgi:enamine deaminase RidA (YjgF/YER057c/UK114 family)
MTYRRQLRPATPPATWIGVTALAHPDLLIEVEAVAVLD